MIGCATQDYVLSVGISRDAQWIVSGSKDRGVHFWDREGVVQCLLQGHKNSGASALSVLWKKANVFAAVISTSLHPVGNLLATGSGDKLARICAFLPRFPLLPPVYDLDSPVSRAVSHLPPPPSLLSSIFSYHIPSPLHLRSLSALS